MLLTADSQPKVSAVLPTGLRGFLQFHLQFRNFACYGFARSGDTEDAGFKLEMERGLPKKGRPDLGALTSLLALGILLYSLSTCLYTRTKQRIRTNCYRFKGMGRSFRSSSSSINPTAKNLISSSTLTGVSVSGVADRLYVIGACTGIPVQGKGQRHARRRHAEDFQVEKSEGS
jgi:hypothetical protein